MQSNTTKGKKRIKKSYKKKTKRIQQKTMKLLPETCSMIRSLDEGELEKLKDYSYSVYIETSKRLSFVRLLNKVKKVDTKI